MLDRRTTIVAFIQCTDLNAAITRSHQPRKLSVPSQKSILNQTYSNSPQ